MINNKKFPTIRTIRYLGNKRKILNDIYNLISDNVKKGGIILDLFAGTNCVSYALKKNYVVYTNDIQRYSYIIAKALIENNKISSNQEHAKLDLSQYYLNNYAHLTNIFKDVLAIENRFFYGNYNYFEYDKYKSFCDNFPHYNDKIIRGYNKNFLSLFSEKIINQYRNNNSKFPYILFSSYFVNGYFGIEQCLQIDSLRYAIDQIPPDVNNIKKMIYLTALIYAISSCVSSTGHFAQYRNINSEISFKEIIKERKKNIEVLFYDLIDELFYNNPFGSDKNISWNENYIELFDKNNSFYSKTKDVDLVYADPPYTKDHYSRFYHVLDTLVKYDYPLCIGKGRYRKDRYNSNFSRPRHIEDEFSILISAIRNIKAKLLLSYTNVGLISLRELKKICSKYYKNVIHKTINYNHSSQGRKTLECKNKESRKEYLIFCYNK